MVQTYKKFIRLIVAFFAIFILSVPCHAAEYERENPVVRAVRKVSPAIVNINSEHEVRRRVNPFSRFSKDSFFDSFFKDFFDPGFEQRYKRTSLGSGVIIDGKRGLILTNAHVLAKSTTITVILNDERKFDAQIIGADPDSDLAVLRISSKNPLPAVEMGDSNDLMIGETIIAIGNPFGFSNTVTTGVISAVNRSIRAENAVYHDFIQLDASINPGNSGGALLNINGELIGINTAIYAKAQGIGFAIPINKAKRIVSDLIQYGEVVQIWLGITVQNLDKRLAQYLKAEHKGVLVKEVSKGGPGYKSGIRDGDIVLSVGSRTTPSVEHYHTAMKNYAKGDFIKITLWRNNKEITVSTRAAVFPEELAQELAFNLLGVKVENLSLTKRFLYKTSAKTGVVISEINRQSSLARIGVRPGDIIRQIDEMTISSIKEFEKAVVKYRHKKSVVILLQRGDQSYYITVKL
ncbi:MAG: Do family serine endopeptidase [Thermodesulfobacteriota bacterium]|nr:Do family serine endopeptidase [Thermodesulfobacteriota bacterium]